MSYDKDDVKSELELEDIYALLEYFDAEPQMFTDYIISRTICHDGDTAKLWYYANTQLFRCYTGSCGSFDVFELVQKVKHLEDLNTAVYFVVNFFNLQGRLNEVDVEVDEDWQIFDRYDRIEEVNIDTSKVELPEYDISILKHYPQPRYLNWEREGISHDICNYMDIHFDPVGGNILIPHRDENHRLVGIRQRTLVQENEEKYGKYKPWRHGKILYNHPLAFNMFGLDLAQQNIKAMETAVVVEGEKAVLQYLSYFGITNNICVAVCGSSLSKYQFNLLKDAGAKEIVIAFDKDFKEIGSEDFYKVVDKLQKLYDKYSIECNISFLFDKENDTLGYKSSPLDCGPDAFLHLWRNRIVI